MKKIVKRSGPCPSGTIAAPGRARADEALRRKKLYRAVDAIEAAYLASPEFSIKDLSCLVLEAAQEFTGSSYGFAAYVDPHTGWLIAPTLSREVWKGRLPAGGPLVFKEFRGLWGWVLNNKKPILTNAAGSDPRSGGTPPGHIPIIKFLAAPALFNKKLAGIVSMANPGRDYGPEDLAAVKKLARVYAIIIQRHLAEDKLKESEAKYRSIIDASQDLIATVNLEGRFTYISRQAENYGYAQRELLGRHMLEFVHPDDRHFLKQSFAKTLKNGTTQPLLRFRIKKKDGSYFYAEQKSGVIMKNGKPFNISFVIRDVTKHRELDLALSRLTQCFLKFGPEPDTNIDLVTRTAGEIFNSACVLYNRLEGGSLCTISDWQAPPDMPRSDSASGHLCFDVISGAKDRAFMVRDLHKSPYAISDPNVRKYKLKTYIGYPVKAGGKNIGALCAVFQTDRKPSAIEFEILSILAKALGIEEQRKQAKRRLSENEETLRKIFDTAKDAIFIKDLEGRFIKVNAACAAIFGLTPRQMEGKNDFNLMPGKYAQTLRDQDLAVMKSGGSLVSDSEIMTVKDGVRTFNSAKTPLYDPGGRITGVLGISRDVTELKKLQNQLIEARAAEVVSKVTRPAAHDFNNILAAINGYATLVMETLKTGNPVKPEVAQILKAVKRAAAITQRLQTYDSGPGKKA